MTNRIRITLMAAAIVAIALATGSYLTANALNTQDTAATGSCPYSSVQKADRACGSQQKATVTADANGDCAAANAAAAGAANPADCPIKAEGCCAKDASATKAVRTSAQ